MRISVSKPVKDREADAYLAQVQQYVSRRRRSCRISSADNDRENPLHLATFRSVSKSLSDSEIWRKSRIHAAYCEPGSRRTFATW
jgi:hypothetical protein